MIEALIALEHISFKLMEKYSNVSNIKIAMTIGNQYFGVDLILNKNG
uniref:Uncharacterized protein n=1 Tax=Wuchereria bancrofti TaxID=6293 RepID=A0A1I8EYQ1_WUCBA